MPDQGSIGKNPLGVQVAALLSSCIGTTADASSVTYVATATTLATSLIPSYSKTRVVNSVS